MAFARAYIDCVLSENFEDAKSILLSPLMAIHYAHLVMLADRGIISPADARAIRDGLDAIREPAVRAAAFDGACEDLFFYVERLLTAQCGADIAGHLHTARSRNDIDMTMYRMWQRECILELVEGVHGLRGALLHLAVRYRDAIYPAHTHTQPAQPSTIGHYLHAVVEQLERDAVRLRAAYASTNRNPLGACAITGTGFPIDRGLTSTLLGFAGPTGNTYGSIATVDYLLESVSVTAILVAGLGRVVQDLLLWCTSEVGALRLADGFVQSSSIMPQKRNPVALEHARAIASKAGGQATAIGQCVHNTPFGDIVDTEDDLQPLVHAMFRDALRTVRLVGAALEGATFDEARLRARAAEGWITITELADSLVRDHGLPFRTTHAIAARLIERRRVHPAEPLADALAAASADVLGTPLQYSEDALQRLLSPEHFVAVRMTHGGPAPQELARALDASREVLEADEAWLSGTRGALAGARQTLRERVDAL